MTETNDHITDVSALGVLSGLVPTHSYAKPATFELKPPSRFAKSMFATMPIILVGGAVAMNLTGPVERVESKPTNDPRHESANAESTRGATDVGTAVRHALANAGHSTAVATAPAATEIAAAPATYLVAAGDTVSSIAGRHGLATASVLALNGLSWSSLIFPGQVLQLTKAAPSAPPVQSAPPVSGTTYTIVSGDTVSGIAGRHGVSTRSVLDANGLTASSVIYPGRSLVIPGASSAPITAAPVAPVAPVAPIAQVAPIAPTTPAPVGATYTIRAGDTVSSIAATHGLSVQAVLDANGLSRSSVIYTGRTLAIPAASTAALPGSAPIGVAGAVGLSAEAQGYATTIISVGRQLGVSDYGIVIALATAMQESTMRNLTWGDRDSVGLFQQRPSSGWGTVAQLTTPDHAARLFYGGPSNPNTGVTRGLLDIAGWESMSLTVAAQKVQISAYPDAYAKWETSARTWLAVLG